MKQYIFLLKIRISHWLILIFLLVNSNVKSQINLVNNYSFEIYNYCPPSTLNTPYNNGWYSAGKKSDDFFCNSCNNNFCFAVPLICCTGGFNYQIPKTGNGYIVLLYLNQGIGSNKRNYIQTKLNDSLKQGLCYVITYYVNLCENSMYACNNIAALLTKTAVYVDTMFTPYGVLPATPQILNYGNPIITDTLNWVKVSSVYTAQGGEQYLTLGNFKYDNQTNYQIVNVNGYQGTAYLIDDVSVIPLDSMCLQADAGKDITINAGDSAFIGSYTNGIDSLLWLENGTIKTDSTRPGFYVTPSSTTFYVLHQIVNGCFSSDTVWVNVLLPLKFISYNIQETRNGINEKQVTSNWTTANEINVSHFNIQRSINGKDFTTIGTIKANNKTYNQYTFYDSPPVEGLGEVYYRIESVDNDGKVNYSETKQIRLTQLTNKPINEVTVYPNPTSGYVFITLPNSEKACWQITVSNIYGKKIVEKSVRNNTSKTFVNIKGAAGIYFINILNYTNGKLEVKKVILE